MLLYDSFFYTADGIVNGEKRWRERRRIASQVGVFLFYLPEKVNLREACANLREPSRTSAANAIRNDGIRKTSAFTATGQEWATPSFLMFLDKRSRQKSGQAEKAKADDGIE